MPSEGYTPPNVEVSNVMMQHSKVKLGWDEDPPERKILFKKLSASQIANMDLDAYLESASEEDEESMMDPNELKKLLLGKEDDDKFMESNDGACKVGDMEMRFSREIEMVGKNVAKRLVDNEENEDKTVWEKYLDKRKEAKKTKRAERRVKIEKQKQERLEAARAAISSSNKSRKEEQNSSDEDDEHVAANGGDDLNTLAQDSRLEKLFKDPQFAVDPTHPRYQKSSLVSKIKQAKTKLV
jgi:hypothetical protein